MKKVIFSLSKNSNISQYYSGRSLTKN